VLPEPSGVFPRYVSPEAEVADQPAPKQPKPKKEPKEKAVKGQD
jgi:hypothetical protein